MVKTEFYRTREDGVNLYRTYSDKQFKIHKIGTEEIYDASVDVENAPYEYEETDIKIDDETPRDGDETPRDGYATEEDYIEALNKLGVE